ncbi:TraR/DksA family transcriptional regulator [Corticibacter populi]|nr:TraR/DksA family transcriptional regulator [Corticibacter populi]RZS33086.1 TraR/DksA family transcriptional regulator [Corticibacter populi]
MTKSTQSQHDWTIFKQRLLARQAELQQEVDSAEDELEASSRDGAQEPEDTAQLAEAKEVRQAEVARDRQELDSIGRALDRLARGVYGLCVRCGNPIDLERLKARPESTHCLQCKEELEAAAAR